MVWEIAQCSTVPIPQGLSTGGEAAAQEVPSHHFQALFDPACFHVSLLFNLTVSGMQICTETEPSNVPEGSRASHLLADQSTSRPLAFFPSFLTARLITPLAEQLGRNDKELTRG